ncbi:MAG: substrate-binding and VWA domain-containing protein [Candidatus Nanopelagicales bacterium]|nr:substrate-binding and VWA domain-containing protein [Candidatus Nanopelagicales bacterium]
MIGVVLIIGARILLGGGSSDPGAGGTVVDAPADRSDCLPVQVVASSEKAALLAELAREYNATGPAVNGTCVDIKVASKASGGAAQALARGWDEQVDGPRPDVWTPASSSWAVLVDQTSAEQDNPSPMPDERPSLVQTPLVIAMPKPMAEALGWPDEQIGWSDLAALAESPKGWGEEGHPEWGRFKLGKTNPNYSTSGLNATIASYFAATGLSSDLTLKNVSDPQTRAFVKQLESSVVHYGDTTLTFLENMANEAAAGKGLTYVSAVTVEEKSVLDYNQGNPTGDPAKAGQSPPPQIPLVAFYPDDGTLISDNPWLVLDAQWVDPQKEQAAGDFLAWLQQPDQQSAFTDAGFRTFEGQPGPVITQENGMLPAGATSVLNPPSPVVLAAIEDSWAELRKRAHVLLVMDVSGSMAEAVPEAGTDKISLAKQAASDALEQFAADDEVGLWVFSTDLGASGEPYVELVPIGPAKQTVPAMQRDIQRLVADGGTGLYATLRSAQAQMLKDLPEDRINAIILLSDGRNEYPPDTDLDGLLRQLNGESVDTTVRVFTIGYGGSADTEALLAIAEASRGKYYEATDPASIEKIMTSVLSNF